jgi:hypothetical protein
MRMDAIRFHIDRITDWITLITCAVSSIDIHKKEDLLHFDVDPILSYGNDTLTSRILVGFWISLPTFIHLISFSHRKMTALMANR